MWKKSKNVKKLLTTHLHHAIIYKLTARKQLIRFQIIQKVVDKSKTACYNIEAVARERTTKKQEYTSPDIPYKETCTNTEP